MSRAKFAPSHLPASDRRTPISTYRIQLQPDFNFADVHAALDYFVALGITDLYLSPILQAAAGSRHGYDVVDHSLISRELGGRVEFEKLADAAHAAGLGIVVDLVPNHMAVPNPLHQNRALWSVLREGVDSPFATWFDGTDAPEGILMPVLETRIGTALAAGEFTVETMSVPGFDHDGQTPVLRYHDQFFPLRPGTETLPIAEVLSNQHYRLAYWRVADEELNYRRFFDVDTLLAVRMNDRAVFEATHHLLLELFHNGHIDAFRVDHPDGLADPRGYLRWLSEETGGAWIAAEKILAPHERPQNDWPIAGTTGYDVSWRIDALQVDPAGLNDLRQIAHQLTKRQYSLEEEIEEGKRQLTLGSLYAEVHRIAELVTAICRDDIRLRDHTYRSVLACIAELVIAMDRYRAYVVPGEPAPAESIEVITGAAKRASSHLTADQLDTLDVVVDLVLGREVGSAGRQYEERREELIVRFQQTSGAVMAKGVEDTAFYRWTQLVSACEVGGSPQSSAITPDEFHSWTAEMAERWPVTMSAGSTHDSKRSEDVRARIGVLSQYSAEWQELVQKLMPLLGEIDRTTCNLLLQTIIGTWEIGRGNISPERLVGYAIKAAREQKLWTSWNAPQLAQEADMTQLLEQFLADGTVASKFEEFAVLTSEAVRTSVLSSKAIGLTALGVADIYNGTETTQSFLVDPDNRRPPELAQLRGALADVYARRPRTLREEKLALTTAVLHLRRRRAHAFIGPAAHYRPLAASTGHLVAFARGAGPDVCTVALRLQRGFAAAGGAGSHTVVLPEGRWSDVRDGAQVSGGEIEIASLLNSAPAVVLERIG